MDNANLNDDTEDRVRIDKWLWAARFFRTRSIAAAAVEGGKVQLNGERTKPSKALKLGDALSVRIGPYTWEIRVAALSERRGRATEAQKLYHETPDSRRAREERAATLRAERQTNPFLKGRPTKKARRDLIRLKQGQR
jgi:ribosome-associated heat shock protein Hsp15